jgi:hypothetical protein
MGCYQEVRYLKVNRISTAPNRGIVLRGHEQVSLLYSTGTHASTSDSDLIQKNHYRTSG